METNDKNVIGGLENKMFGAGVSTQKIFKGWGSRERGG